LIHAIHIAKTSNIKTIVIPMAMSNFTTRRIHIRPEGPVYIGEDISGTFYFEEENIKQFPGLTPLSFLDKQRIASQYLLPILEYVPPHESIDFDNTLCIHIRSGDLFSDPKPHCLYAQPPLDYYTKIIAMNPEKKVYVVYEDDANPVVNALREICPFGTFVSLSLPETIGVFLHAKYIVCGFGTFIYSIATMNKLFQTMYVPLSMKKEHYQADPRVVYCDLPGYIARWKNTEEQRNIMLTYNGSVFVKIEK
jgi:hypothetical protein